MNLLFLKTEDEFIYYEDLEVLPEIQELRDLWKRTIYTRIKYSKPSHYEMFEGFIYPVYESKEYFAIRELEMYYFDMLCEYKDGFKDIEYLLDK